MAGNGSKEHDTYCEKISKDVEYFGAKGIMKEELDSIRERRGLAGRPLDPQHSCLCGLALSGGGIRSASFSLGVMQALAHNGRLEEMDYLSTVSGGGYIGSSLTWILNSEPAFGLADATFPYASFPMSGEARDEEKRTPLAQHLGTDKTKWRGRLLNFLRQNAKYLTPGQGLNLLALVWIALRGAGLGLLVYGSILTLLLIGAFRLDWLQEVGSIPFLPDVIANFLLAHLPATLKQNWFLLAAILGFGLFGISIPAYSIATYILQWMIRRAAYPMRRFYEQVSGRLLPFLLALLLLGIVPGVHAWLIAKGTAAPSKTGHIEMTEQRKAEGSFSISGTVTFTPETSTPPSVKPPDPEPAKLTPWASIANEVSALGTGLATILVGLVSGLMAFLKTKSKKDGKMPLGLLVSLGVAALLFGIVLFGYTIAHAVTIPAVWDNMPAWQPLAACMLTLLLATMTNINHISIHRYYRDRLMETFMPNVGAVLDGRYERSHRSSGANTKPLHAMAKGPYHIVNTNLVLVSAQSPKLRGRGGDNFILSPCWCGSNATGWRRTNNFMDGTMTLASAMAISGAALNPSAGCGGEGITRSTFLSVLMGLLNFRLGYWVPNPNNLKTEWLGLRTPDFILPGLFEVAWRNQLNENGMFLQLSDGGHFENLALYELVRRKLKLIIVCDGGADPKFTFSDLANAMQKVRTDFGALIMIENSDLQTLIPKRDKDDPETVACAEKPYLVATIKYADNSEGTLIYLTTTFFERVSADLYGYKKEHPAFPDESTGDQFFDEKQFEAYRELGFQAAWRMMDDEKATQRWGSLRSSQPTTTM